MCALRRLPAALLAALTLLLSAVWSAGAAEFSDVPENAWFAASADWAVEHGITDPDPDGSFAPDRLCTRSEAVTCLWRCAGRPAAASRVLFRDVGPDDPAAEAVSWAVGEGLVSGYGSG